MISSARRRGAFFLALLGILSLIAALTPGLANAASVEPVEEPFPGGPVTCPAGQTGRRINNAAGNYEVDDVRFSVSVRVTSDGKRSFDFWVTSDHLVTVVYVKGGPPRNVYTY